MAIDVMFWWVVVLVIMYALLVAVRDDCDVLFIAGLDC